MGATEGLPIDVAWSPPSPLPKILPWVVLVVLLVLPPNRHKHAWLPIVPYVVLWTFGVTRQNIPELLEVDEIGILLEILKPCAFAMGGLWLLLPYLKGRTLPLALLTSVPTIGALCFAALQDRGDSDAEGTWVAALVLAGCAVTTLCLSGRICRRSFGVMRLLSSSLGWSVLTGSLGIGITFIVVRIYHGGGPNTDELFIGMAIAVAFIWGLLLPYILISLLNSFHRERLKQWMMSPPITEETSPGPAKEAVATK